MSEIDKLVDLGEWEFMDGQGLFNGDVNILDAAAELAALRARVGRLEHLEAVAADVNEWLKRTELGGTAHQRSLEAALARAAPE